MFIICGIVMACFPFGSNISKISYNGWSISDLTLPSGGYLKGASGVVVDYNLHTELYLFGGDSATYYKRCIIVNRKFYTEGGILKKNDNKNKL